VQPYAQVVAEYDDVGSLTVSYVYGLERISQNRGGTERYYVADGQGSVRYLTDNNGNVTDAYAYYAFGELQTRTGYSENDFMYVGEQFDPNVGLYYNRARWMDPETGRFLSVDPWEGDPMTPVSLHRYLYANASPLSFKDPTGQMTMGEQLIVRTILYTTIGTLLHIEYHLGMRLISESQGAKPILWEGTLAMATLGLGKGSKFGPEIAVLEAVLTARLDNGKWRRVICEIGAYGVGWSRWRVTGTFGDISIETPGILGLSKRSLAGPFTLLAGTFAPYGFGVAYVAVYMGTGVGHFDLAPDWVWGVDIGFDWIFGVSLCF
jgi:RHS repeat-associated protein